MAVRKDTLTIPNGEIFRIISIFKDEAYPFPKHYIHPQLEKPCILDIGANVGLFSLYALQTYPHANIHAFEPSPVSFKLLKENMKYYSNVSTYNIGLSNTDTTHPLYQHPYNSGQDSLVFKHSECKGSVDVNIRHASKFIAALKIVPDIVKIDTEGFEVFILEGLAACLDNIKIVMVEYHSEEDRKAIDKLLTKYTLYNASTKQHTACGNLCYVNV